MSSSTGTWLSLSPQVPITPGDHLKAGALNFMVSEGPTHHLSEEWPTLVNNPPPDLIGLPLEDVILNVEEGSTLIALPETMNCLRLTNEDTDIVVGYKPIDFRGFRIGYRENGFYIENTRQKVYKKVQGEAPLVIGMSFVIGELEFEACRYNAEQHSDTGMRPSNEDAEVIIQNLFVAPHPVSYYAVFDGHGGSECSSFLKDNLHKYLQKHYKNGFSDEGIASAFEECDQDFYKTEPEKARNAGSVAIVVIIDREMLICANVGDSRVLVSQGGNGVQLTKDHKPSVAEEAQRIQANGGLIIMGRLMGQLAVSRAFGDFEFKDLNLDNMYEEVKGPLLTCEPEITRLDIDTALEFVLLSCDGLFEVFSSEEAVAYIREQLIRTQADEQDLGSITKAIVQEAISRRSGDNVSVILITLLPKIP